MVTEPGPAITISMLAGDERLKLTLPLLSTADVTGPDTALSYTTDLPNGTITFATFDRSGMAPTVVVPVVVQLAGLDQFPPLLGPV